MQKYFEKIKERLEELRKAELDRVDNIDENGRYNDCEEAFEDGESQGRFQAYSKMINFINQVAEEFATDTNVGNNDGWILCSSGILPVGDGYEYYDPEEDMTYYRQVLVHTDEVDIPYCVAYYDTDTWFCAVTSTPLVVDRWKPITPYQPKGE